MSLLRTTRDVIGFLVISIIAIIESIVRAFIPTKYKMKSIDGEIALVTGGGGGLGQLLSLRLANLGAIVVVWDINKDGVEETVKLVEAAGGTCYGYVCDICNREEVYEKAAMVREEVGKVTILINNAGIASKTHFMDTPDHIIVRTMDVNAMSHFWTVKAFLPSMMENNKGHIVSIASMAGHVGIPKLVEYCASKYAAVGFGEALRMELEDGGYNNIHITVVCPYFIRSTNMFEGVKSRFVSHLSSNEVAERAITALRCNEEMAVLPASFGMLLLLKCAVPWSCTAMFLRGLVEDVSPVEEKSSDAKGKEDLSSNVPSKEQNGGPIHQQLARRISSSERKP
ncbi:hypothetical protein KM043_001712 [Ampulex compressa]|nr:hypothetical protein KM043_001712 [Ampulex compressa]